MSNLIKVGQGIRPRTLLGVALIALFALVLVALQPGGITDASAKAKTSKQRIAALEKQVKKLTARVNSQKPLVATVGAKGDAGAPGAAGANGANGATGATGARGASSTSNIGRNGTDAIFSFGSTATDEGTTPQGLSIWRSKCPDDTYPIGVTSALAFDQGAGWGVMSGFAPNFDPPIAGHWRASMYSAGLGSAYGMTTALCVNPNAVEASTLPSSWPGPHIGP